MKNDDCTAVLTLFFKALQYLSSHREWTANIPITFTEEYEHEKFGTVYFNLLFEKYIVENIEQTDLRFTIHVTAGGTSGRLIARGEESFVKNKISELIEDINPICKRLNESYMFILDYPVSGDRRML